MKRIIASLIAGIVLGSTALAGAAVGRSTADWHSNGVWCRSKAGVGVACLPIDGSRYGVGIGSDVVMVYDTKTSKTVWWRAN